ncbi:ABC-F family ATP-binding cassette domain-containing protein [Schleiferilactobacillus shenzhenensis]|uniref:YdiF n=1 Tax=Schleiferilactobacillus shenzhenensis LY-73 TaxID=1231336 RepID=U4TPV4_9LACO|nr:ABC-F family ATP-binding cassette domain-containing protein [Schleiferilactobacillus shenzhenensis]ERL65475.1 YdiF [Schleiferilactobacillus shenzhenensis LY-73]
MILLQAQHITKEFNAVPVFTNANLIVQDHDRIGLVGPNGVGKSTLIKTIIGQEQPDGGTITFANDLTWGYLAQDSGLDTNRTIYDEMLTVFSDLRKMAAQIRDLEKQMGADPTNQDLLSAYDQLSHRFTEQNGYGYEAEIRSVLTGFKFGSDVWDKPIATLSGGEKSRLALAKLLLEKRQLLILDEPTNHLDIDTLTWLEGYLRSYPGALLLVSHDQYFLDKLTTQIVELRADGTTAYTGNYSKYLQEREARSEQARKAYEHQQAEIAKLEDYIQKNIVRASTTKMAQSRRKKLEKMVRLPKPAGAEKTIRFRFTPDRTSGHDVLRVTNATVGYDPAQPMAGPININVDKGDRAAIIGPNGVGKSTLLKSILGKIPFLKGTALFGTGVTVGYYDQEQMILHNEKTVLNEVWDDHPTMAEKDIRSVLGSFLFRGDDVLKYVADLSGGEKARLSLVKLALDHDNFLILDEPTNHLDIESKEVLENALQDFAGTILFVSHDRYFINALANHTYVIAPEGSSHYLGNYDYYIAKKAEEDALAAEQAPVEAAPVEDKGEAQQSFEETKAAQREQRKLEREVASLESEIDHLSKQETKVQEAMAAPDVLQDYKKMQELQTQLTALQQKRHTAENDWADKLTALDEDQD